MRFNDDVELRLGTGNDLRLFHNGNNSFIDNYGGNLQIRTHNTDEDIILKTDDGSGGTTNYIVCDGSTGAVKLFHYGSIKLETTSAGVTVTGDITAYESDDTSENSIQIQRALSGGGLRYMTVGISNETDDNAFISTSAQNGIKFNEVIGGSPATSVIIKQGLVGIDVSAPDSYNSSARKLVVGGSGDSGITISTSSTNMGTLMFADGTGGTAGYRS